MDLSKLHKVIDKFDFTFKILMEHGHADLTTNVTCKTFYFKQVYLHAQVTLGLVF